MDLLLKRTYHPKGTNGALYLGKQLICYTIELPYLNNQRRVSCIPEGRYFLKKRSSAKYGLHLLVEGVKNRSLILLHPANHAQKELLGCIAPVSKLIAPGQGTSSRVAFEKLKQLVFPVLAGNAAVRLIIYS